MKKKILLLIIMFVTTLSGTSQVFDWVRTAGSGDENGGTGKSIHTDDAGNVYTSGFFKGVFDFDPGDDEVIVSGESFGSPFTVKYDASGNFLWAKTLNNEVAPIEDMYLDSENNIINLGHYFVVGGDSIDFDPGPDSTKLTAPYSDFAASAIFVQKLDSDGNFLWAKSFGEAVGIGAYSGEVTVDNENNIYICGATSGGDFDPGDGVEEIEAGVFVLKLSPEGDLIWSYSLPTGERARGIDIDSEGNVLVSGFFSGGATLDFGGGIVLPAFGGRDAFVFKLNSGGDITWARMFGGEFSDYSFDLALDNEDNVYYIGSYAGTVDVDPTAGEDIREAVGGFDLFIQKLDKDGNYVWTDVIGTEGRDVAQGIVIHENNLYTTGHVNGGVIDFDTSEDGVFELNAEGQDIYIHHIDLEKNFQNAILLTAEGDPGNNEWGHAITTGISGDTLYTTGFAASSVPTDYGLGNEASGSIYSLKLSPPVDTTCYLDIDWTSSIYLVDNEIAFTNTSTGEPDVVTYYWTYGDEESTEENPTFYYNMEVTEACFYIYDSEGDCEDSLCATIIADTVDLSIDQYGVEPLATYPNPFNDYFTIPLPEDTGSGMISILDATGKLIERKEFNNNQDGQIQMGENLLKGVYFIMLEFEDKKMVKKIIKV